MGLFGRKGGYKGGYQVPEHREAHRPPGMSDSEWRNANQQFDRDMQGYRNRAGLNSDNSPRTQPRSYGPGRGR